MSGSLAGKVALVTGAGSGIGRAAARAFARAGAAVVVADIDAVGGQESAALVASDDGEASFVQTDVTRSRDVEAMVAYTLATYGRLDCALNNAGVAGLVGTTTVDYAEEDWDRVVEVDLKGVWLCMKHELTHMLKVEGGAIVNTASIAGLVGLPGSSPYVASKHGVVGLTKTAALEYATRGIRVNAVCPGVIDTPLVDEIVARTPERKQLYLDAQPIGRLGTPEEVAAAVVWLCTDEASFVTGQAFPVDGGFVAR
ncbi:MAG: SDR family oxidoreductase [Gaiellaceae bacterium]